MIGIFDSGIGGVTVLKEIIKELPNYHYIYYSDSIYNPYGDKTPEELYLITKKIVTTLIQRGCKIIVIACNTASAICKDYLRREFDVPIIAIEPALKMAYDKNYLGNTLVMATKGTMESNHFLELYQKFDNHHISLISCVGLADLIENNKRDEIKLYLKENLTSFIGVDNVVLGCTHYLIIQDEIREVLGDVTFYDGSIGVSKRLKEIIYQTKLKEESFQVEFIDSSKNPEKEKRFFEIL